MSRSIHTTRRDLLDFAERQSFKHATPGEDIREKRLVKRQVRRERHVDASSVEMAALESIPVRMLDRDEFAHYPADEEDIQGLLATFPADVSAGISSITLALGREYQEEMHQERDIDTALRDPYVHRLGFECLPNVWAATVLGTFQQSTAQIELFAYVYPDDLPNREMWEVYLRLSALRTLVHEIAHFSDARKRRPRGRWLMDRESKNEGIAENLEEQWTREYVIPYLEQRYPREILGLGQWIELHAGIDLRIAAESNGGGAADSLWTLDQPDGFWQAVEWLASDVAAGRHAHANMASFAWYLHRVGFHEEAIELAEKVHRLHPLDLEVLGTKAMALFDLGRREEALRLANSLVQRGCRSTSAWLLAGFAIRSEPERFVALATAALDTADLDEAYQLFFLQKRALSHLSLGDLAAFHCDLERCRNYPSDDAAEAVQELESARHRQEESLGRPGPGDGAGGPG